MIILSVTMQGETFPHGLTDTTKALNKILTAVPDSFSSSLSLSHTQREMHTDLNQKKKICFQVQKNMRILLSILSFNI